ncbi:hypothetical protein BJY04DRAFT_58144 [Aspergillus karnatakaensis]|uniref:uncharacterized protein n=1 Tax=Aspergillus karnatakaensis TaxID=1810916 RepID=UPI003CCD3D1D
MSASMNVPITPTQRTKEENQERAFIAASRRKDRSLDARVDSAHRASGLHKQRTGRGLKITREIVESEAMYEEEDSNYRSKVQHMMEAQVQLGELMNADRFNWTLFHPLHQRRATTHLARGGPIHGARKMSLDLSQLRVSANEPKTTPLEGMHPSQAMISPASHVSSSCYSLTPQVQPGQMSSYVASGAPTTMQPHNPPQQLPYHPRPFRDRLASAPSIPFHAHAQAQAQAHAQPQAQAQAQAGSIAPRGTSQHSRVRSEPGPAPLTNMTSSSSSSPFHPGFMSPSHLPTPDPTASSPPTPVSQPATSNPPAGSDLPATEADSDKWSTAFLNDLNLHLDGEPFPHEPADQDFVDFSQFASTLDINAHSHLQMEMHMMPMPMPYDNVLAVDTNMGEFMDMREFITNL